MKTTRYDLTTKKKGINLTAAVVADLHDRSYKKILPVLEREAPDVIFIPGDLTESLETPDGFSVTDLSFCAAQLRSRQPFIRSETTKRERVTIIFATLHVCLRAGYPYAPSVGK